MNYAPGAGSIDRPSDQQSSALPMYHCTTDANSCSNMTVLYQMVTLPKNKSYTPCRLKFWCFERGLQSTWSNVQIAGKLCNDIMTSCIYDTNVLDETCPRCRIHLSTCLPATQRSASINLTFMELRTPGISFILIFWHRMTLKTSVLLLYHTMRYS